MLSLLNVVVVVLLAWSIETSTSEKKVITSVLWKVLHLAPTVNFKMQGTLSIKGLPSPWEECPQLIPWQNSLVVGDSCWLWSSSICCSQAPCGRWILAKGVWRYYSVKKYEDQIFKEMWSTFESLLKPWTWDAVQRADKLYFLAYKNIACIYKDFACIYKIIACI